MDSSRIFQAYFESDIIEYGIHDVYPSVSGQIRAGYLVFGAVGNGWKKKNEEGEVVQLFKKGES